MEINMTSPLGVKLSTTNKVCQEDIIVRPTFEFIPSAKKWDITITEDKTDDFVLLKDDWFAEHLNAENLCMLLFIKEGYENFKPKAVIGTIYKTKGLGCYETEQNIRTSIRITTNKEGYFYEATTRGNDLKTNNPAFGLFGITSDGTVYMGGGDSNYKAGEYYLMAWLE